MHCMRRIASETLASCLQDLTPQYPSSEKSATRLKPSQRKERKKCGDAFLETFRELGRYRLREHIGDGYFVR